MAALAEYGGKVDRGLGRRATADVLWDQVRISANLCFYHGYGWAPFTSGVFAQVPHESILQVERQPLVISHVAETCNAIQHSTGKCSQKERFMQR